MLPAALVQLLSVPPTCQVPLPPLMVSLNLGPASPSQKLNERPAELTRLTCPATEVCTDTSLPPGSAPRPRLSLRRSQIGRASCREKCVSTCRSRWTPYH